MKLKRHPSNQNLTLHFESTYHGLPIQEDKGPFISEYLYRLHKTMICATSQYRETYAFRIDLRLPASHQLVAPLHQNEIIERFIESFKAKIRHNRQKAMRENRHAHDSTVRYVWARESGQHDRPHYHLVIFLNKDAFCTLGKFELGKDNIFNRLNEAWASALGLTLQATAGLVEIPRNPNYYLHRADQASTESFFYRASYLCKAATKTYGNGAHGFGASRT
jgi:hypothetical protein